MDRFVVFDTETSGLPLRSRPGEPPPAADAPGQPRLASFSALVTRADLTVDEKASFSTLVCPPMTDDFRPEWTMSEGASAVNGITDDMLARDGIPIRDVLAVYSDYVQSGFVMVGHGVIFDLKIMRGELRRAGMDDLFMQTRNVCTMLECTRLKVQKLGDKKRGFPTLSDCHAHFGLGAFDGVHTSSGDVKATLAVFRKLVELGVPIEPKIRLAKERASV